MDENANIERHTLSFAFDNMAQEDFKDFQESIEANGMINPSILAMEPNDPDDADEPIMIIDGWHRYLAAVNIGICDELEVEYLSPEEAYGRVLAHNLHRRQLTAQQRAQAIVNVAKWVKRGSPEEKDDSPPALELDGGSTAPDAPVMTTGQMAEAAGVSERTISRAKQEVREQAQPKDPDQPKEVKVEVRKYGSYSKAKVTELLEEAEARIVSLESEAQAAQAEAEMLRDQNADISDSQRMREFRNLQSQLQNATQELHENKQAIDRLTRQKAALIDICSANGIKVDIV